MKLPPIKRNKDESDRQIEVVMALTDNRRSPNALSIHSVKVEPIFLMNCTVQDTAVVDVSSRRIHHVAKMSSTTASSVSYRRNDHPMRKKPSRPEIICSTRYTYQCYRGMRGTPNGSLSVGNHNRAFRGSVPARLVSVSYSEITLWLV